MTFDDLNLNTPLLKALRDLGYNEPTSIQAKAFSVVMSGRDVLGIAQTGTGKTFAYLLPCLRQWTYTKENPPQILIIVPTRELVIQVVEQVEKLTVYMNVAVAGIYGGNNIKSQMDVVGAKLDVLVATPGRLLDLVMKGGLKLRAIKKLVIDEVDEMLNLGFQQQLTSILDLLPRKRQNLLFSATITEEVELLMRAHFNDPQKIEAAPTGTPLDNILQTVYSVPNFNTKVNLLKYLLATDSGMSKVLVFAATKQLADDLFEELEQEMGEQVAVIHSNKAQNNRFERVRQFQNGTCRVLIATDIIARGLDIADVTHVVNLDTPEEPESYMHRIGRTGRADKKGISITFTSPMEEENLAAIETLMNHKLSVQSLPEDLPISNILIPGEVPKINMKSHQLKPKKEDEGISFHEKLDKNKKVNRKISRADKMKLKYGKPQTRGQKKK